MRTRRSLLGGLLLLPSLVSNLAAQEIRSTMGAPPYAGREIQLVTPGPGLPSGVEAYFGAEVALTGEQLLVAAPTYSETAPGAIQVFDRSPTGFVFREQIEAREPDDALFASAMVLDRDLLYVRGTDSGAPAILVFQRDLGGPGEWGQVAVIPLSVETRAFDVEGDTLLVGNGHCCTSANAITVRERNAGGPEAWGVTAVLTAPSTPFGPMYWFGEQVAVDGDVVIGIGSTSISHAYTWFYFVYERDVGASGAWGATAAFPSPYFGIVAGLELANDLLVTTVIFGETTVHERNQGGPSAWGHVQTLPACQDPSCSTYFEPYGSRMRAGLVAIAGREYYFCSDDGATCYLRDLAMVYEVVRSSGESQLVQRLVVETFSNDFGRSVDLLDDRLVVASDLGVHVFEMRASPVRGAPERLPR